MVSRIASWRRGDQKTPIEGLSDGYPDTENLGLQATIGKT